MRFGKHLIAFGGIALLSGAMLPAEEAWAFGQQWRPAPGIGSVRTASYDRIANMPSFRPHSAARPTIQRSLSPAQRRPYSQGSYQRPYSQGLYQRPFYAAQQHPAYFGGVMPVGAGFYPQPPRASTAGYRAPGWSAPFAGMMQPWGLQMPMFTRQFAWRQAEQPWLARDAMPRQAQPRNRVTALPQTAGFRTGSPGFAVPVAGSWRPAVRPAPAIRPQYADRWYAARPSVNTAGRQPSFTTTPRKPHRLPGAHIAGVDSAPVQTGPGYWRPQAGAPAAAWRSNRSFRPQSYGRRLADKLDAAPGKGGSEFTRDNLPGWVTTYQDNGYEGACSWCSGS